MASPQTTQEKEIDFVPGDENLDTDPTPKPKAKPSAPPPGPDIKPPEPKPEVVEEEKKDEEKKEEEPEVDVLDTLVPKADPVTRTFGPEGQQVSYIQKPLSFISKMQFFGLVGEVVDRALSGPDGMTIGHLFDTPQFAGATISAQAFREADTFVQAISKLVRYAPDFLLDCYCIWLVVPEHEQPIVKEIMSLPEGEGGISDSQGIDMIETFIDQNWQAIETFFREEIVRVRNRVQKQMDTAKKSRG